jgi:hypothetical protein
VSFAKPDERAVYDSRTESVRTGTGGVVHMRDLHGALASLDALSLRRILKVAGLVNGVADPMEEGAAETVRDLIALCRGRPQFTLPIIRSGESIPALAPRFEGVLRDRLIGSGQRPAGARVERDDDAKWSNRIGSFFYDSRLTPGEFAYFVRHDKKAVTLTPGKRFGDLRPYEECFLVLRTDQKRYFLRWPTNHRHVPAFYIDKEGRAVDFYPRQEGREVVDFEEIFPGWTYEVFGVQFTLPDLGADYRFYEDESDETELASGSGSGLNPRRRQELLELMEADADAIETIRDLSRHFRQISVKYHPLKHLHASHEEKERISAKYLLITNAYNELKAYFE